MDIRNYEDAKQLLIVRQSQMERAIELMTLFGIKPTSLSPVIGLQEILTEFILTGKHNTQRVKDFNKWLD